MVDAPGRRQIEVAETAIEKARLQLGSRVGRRDSAWFSPCRLLSDLLLELGDAIAVLSAPRPDYEEQPADLDPKVDQASRLDYGFACRGFLRISAPSSSGRAVRKVAEPQPLTIKPKLAIDSKEE
jgi:hypothetical protein